MDEVTTVVDSQLYSFDGRVLEVFGAGGAARFHVRNMHLRIDGPDRKGNRTVRICHGRPDAPAGCHLWRYSAARWSELTGLVELLRVVQAAVDGDCPP
ncbi:hypothetical protein [Streptomyces sp. NBC_01477]|uniref:hypothetical protein n=1 Tax=Streptomyces sp. NBC_01477 TaxID=2976015 RepID=UPI002E3104FE|nr:hypothetical protein [Streptomyces sp. NBC_01477]